MAQQTINNTNINPDSLYVATTKINENFTDLYTNKQTTSSGLTQISALTPSNDDMLVYSDGWINQDVTSVRSLIVDGYAQPASPTLDALTVLTPADGDILSYTDVPENSWTTVTPTELRTNLAASRPLVIEFMEDFLYPKFTSTTSIDSVIPWTGNNLTYYPTTFQYGAVGTYSASAQTSIYKRLYVDNTYTTGVSPGFMLNSGTTNVSMFRVARVASPAASGISYFGHFDITITDASTATSANGAFFKVIDGGNLLCITKNAGGTTSTDSGVTLPDDTFKTLAIVYISTPVPTINFVIDNVPVASHTDNIYSAGPTKFGIVNTYVGPSGQSGSAWIDYLYIYAQGVNRL